MDFITEKELDQTKEAIFSEIASKAKENRDLEAVFELNSIKSSKRRKNQDIVKDWLENQQYIKSVAVDGKGSFIIVVEPEFIEIYAN